MTTTAQQTALEAPVVRVVYFVKFDFLSGSVRASTLNQNIVWDGYTWTGMGLIAGISAIEESDAVEAKALSFSLDINSPSILALAVGSVEEYRGKTVSMWMCPLDEDFKPIDTPIPCWNGYMDTVVSGIAEDGKGNITMKCETNPYGLKRSPVMRLSAAQVKIANPTETGLDQLNDLITTTQLWLSIKFQRQ